MTKKYCIKIFLLLIIIILSSIVIIKVHHEQYLQGKATAMLSSPLDYHEFKELVYQNFYHDIEFGIGFGPEETDFFQIVFKNPYAYLHLTMQLIQDSNVHINYKSGAAAAMTDMDTPDLAKFVDFINTESQNDKYSEQQKIELANLASLVAFNNYRGYSFVRQNLVSKQSLSDHYKRSDVYQVFKNIYDNPYTREADKKKGASLFQIVIEKNY